MVGQVGGPIQAVAVEGNYAYVAIGPRLTILNIADASTPIEVGATAPTPACRHPSSRP
jgi:hypothetical protein